MGGARGLAEVPLARTPPSGVDPRVAGAAALTSPSGSRKRRAPSALALLRGSGRARGAAAAAAGASRRGSCFVWPRTRPRARGGGAEPGDLPGWLRPGLRWRSGRNPGSRARGAAQGHARPGAGRKWLRRITVQRPAECGSHRGPSKGKAKPAGWAGDGRRRRTALPTPAVRRPASQTGPAQPGAPQLWPLRTLPPSMSSRTSC